MDTDYPEAASTLLLWTEAGLKNVRFSGGEPTLWPGLLDLVALAKKHGVERIAISSNGSADWPIYEGLIEAGCNDFSISLDACCAEDGDKMTGGVKESWTKVVENIRELSQKVYTTVGVVLTQDNEARVLEIVRFADELSVSDIRVIPAAQHGRTLEVSKLPEDLLQRHPILRYRWDRFLRGEKVRGIGPNDSKRCALVLDDMAVNHGEHYPCIIYMREGGKSIGKVGPGMRAERLAWSLAHRADLDPICSKNCLDVCVAYNNVWTREHQR